MLGMPPKGVKRAAGAGAGSGSIGVVKKLALLALMLLAALAGRTGLAQPVRVDAVEVELVAQQDAAVPGATALLGLRIRHDPHWHTYWRNPGDSGLPTQVALALPEGWKAGPIVWPAPHRIFVGPLANYAYEDEIVLPMPVEVPAAAAHGRVRVRSDVQWLMCKDVCIPGEAKLSLELPVAADARPGRHAELFRRAAADTPSAQVAVRAHLADGRLSLGFDRPAARTAEFFPYAEGWLNAPAPQSLHRLGDEGGGRWLIELQPVAGVDAAALRNAGFDTGPVGVLRIDGQPFEVRATLTAEPPGAGTLVSTAQGAPDPRASSGAGTGVGSRLLGALGAGPALPGAQPSLTLLTAALFGVIGGLILNLMPCVFPVIGIKVLGFARHAQSHRADSRRGALAFGAGVLLSFWALAGILLALRAAGEAVGWGFQLQSPAFVAAMALLFVLIGMNFAGVFEIGLGLTRLGNADARVAGSGNLTGSFGSGVLAVLVATPCTAPFMGSALGFTLGRSVPEVLTVFSAIAVGMALPYLFFGFFPRALAWLPRPGRWMESFRQFLAFPMFATAAWLAWVLGLQAGIDAVLALAIGAVLVALAAWLYGRFVQAGKAAAHRVLAGALGAVALVVGVWLGLPSAAAPTAQPGAAGAAAAARDDAWEPWSEARVAQALSAGRGVFVDFTAAWCVSCQANKALVLTRDPVASEMRARGVVQLRADWTNRDPAITDELARHGRNGVPLYLVYVPGEPAPRVLPELLSAGMVMEALRAIR